MSGGVSDSVVSCSTTDGIGFGTGIISSSMIPVSAPAPATIAASSFRALGLSTASCAWCSSSRAVSTWRAAVAAASLPSVKMTSAAING